MLKKIFDKLLGANTLYYPGCLTKFVFQKVQGRYEDIFKKCGVDFIMLENEELCCGSPPRKAGYRQDFENIKKKNLGIFKKYSVRHIITNCPTCALVFRKYYGITTQHVTQVVYQNLKRFQEAKNKKKNSKIYYHDPCHLGRQGGVYEEPRKILEHLGYKVIETRKNRDKSMCCGAGGGMKTNFPKLSNKIAKYYFKQLSEGILTSPCPMCYAQFKENAPKWIKVIEFSELLI